MFQMWHRSSPGALWVRFELFGSRAEAERLSKFLATPGQYTLTSLGGRPGPDAKVDFHVAQKRRVVRRSHNPDVDPRLNADAPGRGTVRYLRGGR